jgi:hypothetical protein
MLLLILKRHQVDFSILSDDGKTPLMVGLGLHQGFRPNFARHKARETVGAFFLVSITPLNMHFYFPLK